MATNNEPLAMRFVELLAERALRNGQTVSRWTNLPAAWRRIFTEVVAEFLDEQGGRVNGDGAIDQRVEDEQVRLMCQNLSARQRLKTYRQLYALGCRIDGIDYAIEKLTKPR